jgi:diguanylate cyclase (GGDEF)-like protein
LWRGAARVSTGDPTRPAVVVPRDATVREAHARFLADPALGLVILGGDERLSGQVTRRGLERFLANPGAWERLADQPLHGVADHQPLSVMSQLDVVEVGAILAARPNHEIADDLVVTDPRGRVVGVAAVRDVLRTLAETRPHGEHDIHPLSGLLGPGWIEAELARRLEYEDAVTVLCLDLDGFRALNDLGGFSFGDDVIRHVGRCLTGAAGGVQAAAAAHVGSDDFILVVPPRGYEELVGEIVRSFESEVMPFLRTELRLRQAEHVLDRLGLSISAVDLAGEPPPGLRYLDWARDLLALPMRSAKQQAGYACVHQSGTTVSMATWVPRRAGHRSISLGLSEPGVVLAALDLIDRAWEQWWVDREETEDQVHARRQFPGPPEVVADLLSRHGGPLRQAAGDALAAGSAVMEVRLTGDEAELLELLDRVALVTRQAHATRRLPIPPELSLLDRLLRQRARVIMRQDLVTLIEVGPEHAPHPFF